MFSGKNELIINQASMIEALQEYIDKRLSQTLDHKPVVLSVMSYTAPVHGQAFKVVLMVENEKTIAIPEQPKLLHFRDSEGERG